MSADTTVVIAARQFVGGERRYTAAVVQNVEDLFGEDHFALYKARQVFFKNGMPWLRTLPNAKRMASVLADDLREVDGLEYENRPVILITDNEVVRLSRKGNPLRH